MKHLFIIFACCILSINQYAQIGGTPGSPDNVFYWQAVPSGTTNQLRSVFFASGNAGWVTGANGTILRTVTKGTSWVAQTSGTAQTLNAIWIGLSTGWTVGDAGTILKTTNAGDTWTPQTSGTTRTLYSVFFIDNNIGWCSGGTGTILKTINGGTTWVAQTSGTTNSLYDIRFKDASTGIATGNNGVILKTINGGSTWATQTSGTTAGLAGVFSLDYTRASAVGDGGKILLTTNGGSTWATQTSITTNSLSDISFRDSFLGWAVGDGGTIVTTTDAGATWAVQPSGNTSNLNGVFFENGVDGWAVGNNGTILKYGDIRLLPVTIVGFTANAHNQNVILNWQTSNEVNVKHFAVERSLDGINFTAVGIVNATGTTIAQQHYSYSDNATANDIIYYRLKITDKDGSSYYSKIVLVKTLQNGSLKIYPNPVKEMLLAKVNAVKDEAATLQITDMQGKILVQKNIKLTRGINTVSLHVSGVAKGNYIFLVKATSLVKQQFIKD